MDCLPQRGARRLICTLSLALGLLLAACGEDKSTTPDYYQAMLGKPLPELSLKTLEGFDVPLTSAAAGDGLPAVINIWATWCPPCLKELPSLNNLFEEGEVAVLTIAVDREVEPVQKFITNNGLVEMPVLWDPQGTQTRSQWQARQLPVTYVLDGDGILRGVEVGERVWDHPKMLNKIKAMVE